MNLFNDTIISVTASTKFIVTLLRNLFDSFNICLDVRHYEFCFFKQFFFFNAVMKTTTENFLF